MKSTLAQIVTILLLHALLANAQEGRGRILGVEHPQAPLFRVDARGLPVVSETSGYLALIDEGPWTDYWTYREGQGGKVAQDRWTRAYNEENWGQIDAFACLARGLADYFGDGRSPRLPVRIGHISGRFGGFPDLTGGGRSSHLSHQTGQHFNIMVVPRDKNAGKIYTDTDAQIWDAEATRDVINSLVGAGGHYLVTHQATALTQYSKRHQHLQKFPKEATKVNKANTYHHTGDGRLILFLQGKHNHADHINVLFWPAELQERQSNMTLVPTAGKTDPALREKINGAFGTMKIVSKPARASAFLDGIYVGETGPGAPLNVHVKPGRYQLRISRRGYNDIVGRVLVDAAPETEPVWEGRAEVSHAAVDFGVGQIARAGFATPNKSGAHIYQFTGRAGQKRALVNFGPANGATYQVLSPSGRPLKLKPIKRISGQPQVPRLEWTLNESGTWRIIVTPRKAGSSYCFGLEVALMDYFVPEGKPRSRFRLPGAPDVK